MALYAISSHTHIVTHTHTHTLSLSLSLSHTHTHTHARTHAHTHTHTQTHTPHTYYKYMHYCWWVGTSKGFLLPGECCIIICKKNQMFPTWIKEKWLCARLRSLQIIWPVSSACGRGDSLGQCNRLGSTWPGKTPEVTHTGCPRSGAARGRKLLTVL